MIDRASFVFMDRDVEVALCVHNSTSCHVVMKVDNFSEIVEPVEGGFLTGPLSSISKLFSHNGVMLIPYEGSYLFMESLFSCRQVKIKDSIQNWSNEYGMAQGGIIYGVLRPGLQTGWYAVYMMLSADGFNYTDYVQPDFIFLGENNICERIRSERGAGDVYVHNGIAFAVTLIDREDMYQIFEGYRVGEG